VIPPKIVVNHRYYRMMFDCETYALDNKSVVYTRRQDRTLGRRKKDVAQSFGAHDEWDGSRGCQNTVFWPYPGQNTDIIQNMAQHIRP